MPRNKTLSMRANVLWNTGGVVFYQGCLWLMTVLVVRLSTDFENSGMLAFAMSIGNIYTALGTYNMRTYQISDVHDENSPSNYVALRIVTVLGGLALCLAYSLMVSPGVETLAVIAAFLLFKCDEAFANVLYGIDQKASRMDVVGISQVLRGVLCVGMFCAGLVLTDSLALALLMVAASCIAVTLLYDVHRSRLFVTTLRPSIERDRCVRLLKTCLPSVLGLVIGGFVVASARQYFGIAYGAQALGIYASVATPCVIIQVLAQNLYIPMLGPIAEAHKDGDARKARAGALKLLALVAGVALAMAVLLAIFARPLLVTLYGPSIEPYVPVLFPAMIVMTGVACAALLTDLLIVFDSLKMTLAMNGIAFVINLALIVPSTALWYMNGINISLIVAYAIAVAFGMTMTLKKASRPDGDERSTSN